MPKKGGTVRVSIKYAQNASGCAQLVVLYTKNALLDGAIVACQL